MMQNQNLTPEISEILRPYQVHAIRELRRSIRSGKRAPILVASTGCGKTVMAAAMIQAVVERGKRVLFFAPRRELIGQCSRTLDKFDIFHGIIMRGERLKPHLVQVASWDSFRSWLNRGKIEPPKADMILIDEAHLSLSREKVKIIKQHYPNTLRIGMTATPARSDGTPMGDLYDDLVIATDIRQLTNSGWLVPLRYYAPSIPDLEGLKVVRGDYETGGIDKRFDRPEIVGDVVEQWFKLGENRKTVVFANTIAHANHIAERFQESGISAGSINSKMTLEQRKKVLWEIEHDKIHVITNVGILTFGYDHPPISCAVLARPTKSIVYYMQTVGRILRPHPGKQDAILIDHGGVVNELGFIDDDVPWTLSGKERVQDVRAAKKRERGESEGVRCGSCGFVYRQSQQCPECGWTPPQKKEAFEVYDGDLVEISKKHRKRNREYTLAEKQSFMAQLKAYAISKNFKIGWAMHKYREKFGVWPNRLDIKGCAPANEIGEEVKNWIKSRRIAWIKRKERMT